MSYILDALQRAQAQREQGSVPGLHTPTLAQPARTHTSRTVWGLVVLVAAVGLALLGLWLWPTSSPPPPIAPPAPAPNPPALSPLVSVPTTPNPPVAPIRVTPPAATAASAAVRTAAGPAPTDAPAGNDSTLPTLAQLPDEVRRQIPALSISGAVKAQDPRNSLLLVNGQVVSPGAELGGGLVLESVDAHAAVLRLANTRFRVTY